MADVVWTYGASEDLQKIFEFLENGRSGAGVDFMMNTDARLQLVKLFPRMNRFYLPPFRKLRLMGNFGLFYIIESRGIVVHAVADLRQDPSSLRRRLFGED